MQLFVSVLINIFIAVVFYLIITVKLERSANEFRQQRLKKEMDEMMRDFSAAAERYISVLENRISAAKRLLEKTGNMQSVDITVSDEGARQTESISPVLAEKLSAEPKENSKRMPLGFRELFAAFAEPAVSRLKAAAGSLTAKNTEEEADTEAITRELVLPLADEANESSDTNKEISDEMLAELFATSEDKYALACELLKDGCSADSIIRFSNMPAGEVMLIVNLLQEQGADLK